VERISTLVTDARSSFFFLCFCVAFTLGRWHGFRVDMFLTRVLSRPGQARSHQSGGSPAQLPAGRGVSLGCSLEK
jgi:hypothetical protein